MDAVKKQVMELIAQAKTYQLRVNMLDIWSMELSRNQPYVDTSRLRDSLCQAECAAWQRASMFSVLLSPADRREIDEEVGKRFFGMKKGSLKYYFEEIRDQEGLRLLVDEFWKAHPNKRNEIGLIKALEELKDSLDES